MGSYDGSQVALNPVIVPVFLYDTELEFVIVGFTPSFADRLPFPGPSSLSYEKALLTQRLSHLGPAQPLWPGKSVRLLACLSPQESLHLNCCRQEGQLPQLHLPVFAHLCSPCLEKELTLWLAPHQ